MRILGVKHSINNNLCLDRINLNINKNETLFISGRGKTILLQILSKFIKPDKGEIYFYDKNITNLSTYECNFKYIMEDPVIFPYMNVIQNIRMGFRDDCSANEEKKDDVIKQTIALLSLDNVINKHINELSNSNKFLISFARSMIQNSPLVLIDNPYKSLDYKSTNTFNYAISEYKKLGITFIITTNDLQNSNILADRIAIIEHKQIRDLGTKQEIMNNPKSIYSANMSNKMYAIRAKLIELETDNIVIGSKSRNQKSTINIPKSIINNISIYGTNDKEVICFIHYQNILYTILTNNENIKQECTRFNSDKIYFICNNISKLDNAYILKLALLGNEEFIIQLVVNDNKINIGGIIQIKFNTINLFVMVDKDYSR